MLEFDVYTYVEPYLIPPKVTLLGIIICMRNTLVEVVECGSLSRSV
jgi:hypothetical protein